MSAIKVTYFPLYGRGGPIRVALKAAGLTFEDCKVSFGELPALKPSLPAGQLPVMEIDGQMVSQSVAILRWAGKKTGLYPTDDMEALRVDEAIDHFCDLFSSLPQAGEDKEAFKAAREKWVGGKAAAHLSYVDKQLGVNTAGPFLLGEKISIFELFMVGSVMLIEAGWLDHVPKDLISASYKNITAAFEASKAHTLVAEEIAALAPPS